MMKQAKRILKTVFGYDEFISLQARILDHVLNKKDALVVMPTGGGKSLCYQIPALIFDGVTIIVSPLISLMKDQVAQLEQAGVCAALLNSSLSPADYRRNVERVKTGKAKMLYLAPETLLKENILTLLSSVSVSFLAIDEAHCISSWGHDFRPEYRQLINFRREIPNAVSIALTATATPRVRKDIKDSLEIHAAGEFIAGFDRQNLLLRVVLKDNPFDQVLRFLERYPDESGIIYCFSRKQVDDLCHALKIRGMAVCAYHAGMTEDQRTLNQDLFAREDIKIMVATIAFGMGINKSNVRFVIHYDMPQNMDSYYQEIGRAGRDGLPSECLLLFSYGDIHKVRFFIDKKEGQEKRVAAIHLNDMIRYAETDACRRTLLLDHFGETYSLQNCGMCDNCLAEKESSTDFTVAAQKFLSCVKRTGERFGAGHIVDVLRGSEAQKVLNLGHDNLSTYGIGREYSRKQWMHLSRQFLNQGILYQDEEYGGLSLTSGSWEVLKGRQRVLGSLPQASSPELPPESERRDNPRTWDPALFDILRKKRKELADETRVPPYVIFSDKTLVELATFFPHSRESLIKLHGIGEVKADKYGQVFLEVIRLYCKEKGIEEIQKKVAPKSPAAKPAIGEKRHMEIGEAFSAGRSVEELAAEFNIKRDTVVNHLYKYTCEGYHLVPEEILKLSTLSPEQQDKVIDAFKHHGTDRLRPVFDAMGESVGYEELRIICLYLMNTQIFIENRATGDLPDSPHFRTVVCLANSRKYSGACIAGKEILENGIGGWIRPVGNRETGELTATECLLENGRTPALLDIVSIPLERHCPHDYQVENHLLGEGGWIRKGKLSPDRIQELCDPVDALWINGYHSRNGVNDRFPLEHGAARLTSSLLFIQPDDLRLIVKEGSHGLNKVRAGFQYRGTEYRLTVTDPAIEKKYIAKAGAYPVSSKENTYITVSISEPFEGFCYKLVAGIIPGNGPFL